MKYNFDTGDNITITDDFIDWLENLKKENEKNKDKLKQVKESIDFYNNYNVDETELIDNIEKIIE